jgi:hypothetical protein
MEVSMREINVLCNDGELARAYDQGHRPDALSDVLTTKYSSLFSQKQTDPAAPPQWVLVPWGIGGPEHPRLAHRFFDAHLFLDQDGTPTLVCVKRHTDPRLGREAMVEMLDFAADVLARWPVEAMRASFETGSVDPSGQLARLLGGNFNEDDYWEAVSASIRAGNARLVIVMNDPG